MSREEAKTVFLNRGYVEVEGGTIYDADKWRESCRVISEWLEQEPCEDAISREDVINLKWRGEASEEFLEGYANAIEDARVLPPVTPQQTWIPVSERLPKTDNENSMNNYNVLLWVKNKSYSEREPQIYLGKLRHIDGDDGSGNFWGIETKPCDWTIWGWSYFNEPEVIAWMPLPKPYKGE